MGDRASVAASGSEIRRAAMDLLARREYARGELAEKLKRRFTDAAAVARELERLAEEGLQCDSRFAEAFIHGRARRFYGPQRIGQELRQRGLDGSLIDAALRESGVDWLALLRDLQQRRFGDVAAPDTRERARRQRFLRHRGFTADQLRAAASGPE